MLQERLKALTDIVWPEIALLVKERIQQAREEGMLLIDTCQSCVCVCMYVCLCVSVFVCFHLCVQTVGLCSPVAQLVEHGACNARRVGSEHKMYIRMTVSRFE